LLRSGLGVFRFVGRDEILNQTSEIGQADRRLPPPFGLCFQFRFGCGLSSLIGFSLAISSSAVFFRFELGSLDRIFARLATGFRLQSLDCVAQCVV
jgi:hypothetical protein